MDRAFWARGSPFWDFVASMQERDQRQPASGSAPPPPPPPPAPPVPGQWRGQWQGPWSDPWGYTAGFPFGDEAGFPFGDGPGRHGPHRRGPHENRRSRRHEHRQPRPHDDIEQDENDGQMTPPSGTEDEATLPHQSGGERVVPQEATAAQTSEEAVHDPMDESETPPAPGAGRHNGPRAFGRGRGGARGGMRGAHRGPRAWGHGHGPRNRGGPWSSLPDGPVNMGELAAAFASEFFGGAPARGTNGDGASVFTPAVDVFTLPGAYHVHASLPGASKADINVEWDPEASSLRLSGVVHRGGDEEFLAAMTSSERREVGAFERSIPLGAGANASGTEKIDVEGITAKLEEGVLKVVVPRLSNDGFVDVKKVDVE